MNRKTLMKLSVLAVCSALLFLLTPGNGGSILVLAAMPFTLLGKGLRVLSLSGPAGNIAAIVIYVTVCLLPLVLILRKKKDKEDWLLVLGSAMLFYVLYLMINPGLMLNGMSGYVGSAILCGTVVSVFVSWGILKLLHKGETMEIGSGYHALRVLLGACAALYIVAGFGIGTGELKAEIEAVRTGNTMPGQNLLDTYIFLFFIYSVQVMEYTLDACLMILGIELTKELEQNPYSESCVMAAGKMSKKAQGYLTVILLSNMVLNIAQVLAASRLYNIDAMVRIPVFSVALCLGSMVLTRLLGQGKEIKEEYDLYI